VIRIGRLWRERGISVARPTPLGNPFPVGASYTRAVALARSRAWIPGELERNAKARAQLARIVAAAREGDVTLLCWCAPLPCHAEMIARLVESELARPR